MTSRQLHEDAWLRRVSDYHSGDVDPIERAAVEAHLETCAECRDALALYRRLYALAALPSRLGLAETTPEKHHHGRAQVHGRTMNSSASTLTRRPWAVRVAAVAVAILVVAGFLTLFTPWLALRGAHPVATPTHVPTTTTPEVTASPTVTPFVCANASGSKSTYAFTADDQQLYLVAGCATPQQLTHLDVTKQRVIPQGFSPTNHWLMVIIRPSQAIEGTPSSPSWCQAVLETPARSLSMTSFCTAYWKDDWVEWPEFIGWLDDRTFLEALFQRDQHVKIVRVDATSLATTPVTTLTWVANMASGDTPSGIRIRGQNLFYGGYASTAEGGAWLHRYSLATGADTQLVRLGVADTGGCQVAGPCDYTGPWDVSPDGQHIAYYSPGPTRGLSDTDPITPVPPQVTALYYARADGTAPVRLFTTLPQGTIPGYAQMRISPDGHYVAVQLAYSAAIQSLPNGRAVTLPAGSTVDTWRGDSQALVTDTYVTRRSAFLYRVDGTITALPGDPTSYVWGT